MKKIFSLAILALLFCSVVKADNTRNTSSSTNAAPAKAVVKPYPLDRCVICGMLVKGRADAFTFVYKGQEIKLCDKSEREEFERQPEKYLKKMLRAAEKQTNSVSK